MNNNNNGVIISFNLKKHYNLCESKQKSWGLKIIYIVGFFIVETHVLLNIVTNGS